MNSVPYKPADAIADVGSSFQKIDSSCVVSTETRSDRYDRIITKELDDSLSGPPAASNGCRVRFQAMS